MLGADQLRGLGEDGAAARGHQQVPRHAGGVVGDDAGGGVEPAALDPQGQVGGVHLPGLLGLEFALQRSADLQPLLDRGGVTPQLLEHHQLHRYPRFADVLHQLPGGKGLAAQPHYQHGPHVGVGGDAGQRPPHLLQVEGQGAAALAVEDGHVADLLGYAAGRLVDAAHAGEDDQVVADAVPAVGPLVSDEGVRQGSAPRTSDE